MRLKSLAKEAWRRLRVPVEVIALPKRWVWVFNELKAVVEI
jgi:hypothetical protein